MQQIRVVVVEPQQTPYAKEINNTLKAAQDIVGGYIEVINWRGLSIVVNEEGKLQGLKPNRMIVGFDILVGTFFITKIDEEGNHISLTDSEVSNVIQEFTPSAIRR